LRLFSEDPEIPQDILLVPRTILPEPKAQRTKASVAAFIAAMENDTRRDNTRAVPS
jgi:hypothetical protein